MVNQQNPDILALGAGEILTATFTLTSADGTASKDVVIEIHHMDLIDLDPNLAAAPGPGLNTPIVTDPIADPILPPGPTRKSTPSATTDPIATSSPATPIESGVGGTAAAETITTASLTTAAALSTDAPSPEPITIETTAVETVSVATVEATSDPTPAVSSLGPIDFSVAADGLDFRPSLVRDGGSPGDGWLPDLGERLDTGLANVLHHALDRIGSDHPGAEHLASVLQSVVDRLDEPDHAVLDWLQSHLRRAYARRRAVLVRRRCVSGLPCPAPLRWRRPPLAEGCATSGT